MALSPRVTEMVEKVRRRMAVAPTVSLVRRTADEALASSRDPLTAAEIRHLADAALAQAREVEVQAARLAELLTGASR